MYKKKEDSEIVWKDFNGEIIVLNVDNGSYFTGNEVASHIWKLIIEGNSISDCTKAICNAFEIEEEIASKDVSEVVKYLIDQELIEKNG